MKSFIIHLPSVSESLRTATKLKNDLEKFNMEAELYEGVRGDDAVKIAQEQGRTYHPVGLKGAIDPDGPIAKKAGRPGVIGCFFAHYGLWKKCLELNEPILIWEDDIILSREFKPIDWEEVLVVALGHPYKSPRWMHLLEEPTGDPEPLKYRGKTMPGCCGYGLTPQGAQKLVDHYSSTYLPADNAINTGVVKIQIHNYVMGIAQVNGKISLTRFDWQNQEIK